MVRWGLVAFDALKLGVSAGQLKTSAFVVVEQQGLALPCIRCVARGTTVAEFSSVRIRVTRAAVGLEPTKNSARQHLFLPRLMALRAFDLGVAADKLKLGMFAVVK